MKGKFILHDSFSVIECIDVRQVNENNGDDEMRSRERYEEEPGWSRKSGNTGRGRYDDRQSTARTGRSAESGSGKRRDAGSKQDTQWRQQSAGNKQDTRWRQRGAGNKQDARWRQRDAGNVQDTRWRQQDMRWNQPQRPRRVLTLTNLLVALVGFLFIFSLSVVVVLNLRTIYYFDIRYQQLEQATGLSEETIRENYDTLIDYNLLTKRVKKLEFPDFPMSEHGRIHFAEVKRIFLMIQWLCIVSGVILVISLFKKLRRRDYGSLKLMSILTFLVPVVLGVSAALNWDAFFIKFHELFFKNNYWIFDPVTDPVIRILPDAFFFHCAVVILLFLVLGCVLTGAMYRFATRKYRRQGY